jgi:hypothetical protein
VVWRSDRRFEDAGARLDFTQKQAEVRLSRWGSDVSHVQHLRYVGGGGALAEFTRDEIPEAAAELAGRPSPSGEGGTDVAGGPRVGDGGDAQAALDAAALLAPADVSEVTGFVGEFDVGDLGDEPPSPWYNSVHFQAKGKDEDWDVALRVWRVQPDEAEELYGRLIGDLPGVKETDEIGDRSLRAVSDDGSILGAAVLIKSRGVVVLVQCGASQCKNGDVVAGLARKVLERAETAFPAVK